MTAVLFPATHGRPYKDHRSARMTGHVCIHVMSQVRGHLARVSEIKAPHTPV